MMTDYIEKNSVIELIDDAICNCKWHVAECTINTDDRDLKTLREKVKAMPAEDVVKIVRCKDCVHKVENDDGLICGNISMGEYGEYVDDNHFFSDGERRS